jgi:hypothetical protein
MCRYDVWLTPFVKFPQYITKFGLVEPTSQTSNPMTWGNGQVGKNPWEIISQDPEWMDAFDVSMRGQDEMMPVTGIYDFNELRTEGDGDRKVMVDVGGGRGQAIMKVLEEFPELPKAGMVLQDRAPVIEAVEKAGELPVEVEKMVIDFMEEQPVKGLSTVSLILRINEPATPLTSSQERNHTTSVASSTTSLTQTVSIL